MSTLLHNSRKLLVILKVQWLNVEPASPFAWLDAVAGTAVRGCLAAQLLQADEIAEGEPTTESLIDGKYFFEVRDVARATKIIVAALKTAHLAPWASVFFFDPAEHLWRSIYPAPGGGLLIEEIISELEKSKARGAQALRIWEEGCRKLNQSNNDAARK